MKANTQARRPVISTDGHGLVNHAGTRALVELADRLGLTEALGARPSSRRRRRSGHDPGVVLRDVAVGLAEGGTCLSDLAVLRDQPELFGQVASHATVWRTIERVAADELGGVDGLRAARAAARRRVWDQGGGPPLVDGMLVVDVDATLVDVHSDKDGAAGTYKGGFGYYPLLAYVDHGEGGTGEPLAGVLRAGNAGSNTVIDHHDILQLVLEQLPVGPQQVPMLVRADSAGATHGFVDALRAENIMFSVGFDVTAPVRAAVLGLPRSAWVNAIDQDGARRDGAQVAELHNLDLAGWPEGTRAIARRERPHPGAQLSFVDADGWRVTCFITDQPDADVAELERRHRAHARVEDRIRNGKDSGLARFPCGDFARNQVWLELVLCGQDLLAWLQRLALDGDLATADPRTLRQRVLHVAARVARHARRVTLRLQASWPWTAQTAAMFARVRALPAPG